MRSTGRKDRHSKVCTAKGPRDRRVRLSAHTAIQFYDVQDRLGYDRPSKAVDWLIKKAKPAIDKLDELPTWKPATVNTLVGCQRNGNISPAGEEENEAAAADEAAGDNSMAAASTAGDSSGGMYVENNADKSSLLPPSIDSGSIADTIKSFFPMRGTAHGEVAAATSAGAATTRSAGGLQSMQLQSYPQQELLSGSTISQRQNQKLSLQPFQDPIGFQLHHHSEPSCYYNHHHRHGNQEVQQQPLFQGANPILFENPSTGWAENQRAEMGLFQRLVGWNSAGGGGAGDCSGSGLVFMPPQQPLLQPLFGHVVGSGHGMCHGNNDSNATAAIITATNFFSERGPLQSSNTPAVRAWMGNAATDSGRGSNHHNDDHQAASIHPVSLSGIGFTSSGGFSGFHIPARIQGSDMEEHDGNPNKPSSASSGSHH